MRLRFQIPVLVCLLALAAAAQEPLNNEGIIKLVKSGMTEDLIINVIQQQPGTYVFGAGDLVTLKESSVSEKIIAAMLAKSRGDASASPAGAVRGPGASTSRSAIPGPGIFYKKGGEYFELLNEDVEWKTSGAMKNIASAGIVKKDMNGSVAGPSSRNFLTNPMEIVISLPPGVTANSYILLPMKPDKGVREFNVGPVNRKSGVAKGAIPFGLEKIGESSFRIVLQTPLSPGEYGILTAAPDTSVGSGKMHTFRILL